MERGTHLWSRGRRTASSCVSVFLNEKEREEEGRREREEEEEKMILIVVVGGPGVRGFVIHQSRVEVSSQSSNCFTHSLPRLLSCSPSNTTKTNKNTTDH